MTSGKGKERFMNRGSEVACRLLLQVQAEENNLFLTPAPTPAQVAHIVIISLRLL